MRGLMIHRNVSHTNIINTFLFMLWPSKWKDTRMKRRMRGSEKVEKKREMRKFERESHLYSRETDFCRFKPFLSLFFCQWILYSQKKCMQPSFCALFSPTVSHSIQSIAHCAFYLLLLVDQHIIMKRNTKKKRNESGFAKNFVSYQLNATLKIENWEGSIARKCLISYRILIQNA